MRGPDPEAQVLLHRLEQERLVRRLALARVLREGQPDRPSLVKCFAAALGDALIALGRRLVAWAGRATSGRPASSLGSASAEEALR